MDVRKLVTEAVVFDTETSIGRDPNGLLSPMPWHGGRVVALHAISRPLQEDQGFATIYGHPADLASITKSTGQCTQFLGTTAHAGRLLVGHNIKFDLHHLINEASVQGWEWPHVTQALSQLQVWDTMVAEYLLSGQRHTSISLEDACELRGIAFKKDQVVVDMFNQGFGADVVDKTRLLSYLKLDVESTMHLFLSQVKEAMELGGPDYVAYMINMMGAVLATVQMEYSGIGADKAGVTVSATKLEERVSVLEKSLSDMMEAALWKPPELHSCTPAAKPSSAKGVAMYLFGGERKYQTHEEIVKDGKVVRYKTGKRAGQIKTRIETSTRAESGCVLPDISFRTGTATDDKTLKDILRAYGKSKYVLPPQAQKYIEDLLEYRKLSKDLGTYHEGLAKAIANDGRIHPSFNHAIARTKRLTSSRPNMQNVSNKDTDEDGD